MPDEFYPHGFLKVPSKQFPGESTIACPKCRSYHIVITGRYHGIGTGPGGSHRAGDYSTPLYACLDCGHTNDGIPYVHRPK